MQSASGTLRCSITAVVTIGLSIIGSAGSRLASAEDPRAEKFSGKVMGGVMPDGLRVVNGAGKVVFVVISSAKLTEAKKDKTLSVSVTGDAEANFLSLMKGQVVSFSTTMSGGRPKEDLDELTLLPNDEKQTLEMSDKMPNVDEAGTAAEKSDKTSSYLVSGIIQSFSFKDGQLLVRVPNDHKKLVPIKFHVADKAKINVHLNDFSFARAGDAVDVDGYSSDPKDHVSTIIAENVSIVGAAPFADPKKAKALLASKNAAAKAPKPRPAKTAASETPAADESAIADASGAAQGGAVVASATGGDKSSVKAAVVRQAGDPPAEPLDVVDEYSVDLDFPAAKPAKPVAK
jgi:hypothetical protein